MRAAEWAPAIARARNAVRLGMDYRPFVGLMTADEGSLIERVIATVVLDEVFAAHEQDVKNAEAASRS